MIVPHTTALIKRASAITGIPPKSILRTTRDKNVNAVRAAIWSVLLDLGHTRQRIAQAFGCDFKTIQWALDHPTAQTRILTRQLTAQRSTFRDCGSGQNYGICRSCGKAHGYVIPLNSSLP